MRVRIGHLVCPVKRWPEGHDYGKENFGEFDGKTIYVRTEQSPEELANTLVHECIHAMCKVAKPAFPINEERLCEVLESILTSFIADNQRFLSAVRKAFKGDESVLMSIPEDDE